MCNIHCEVSLKIHENVGKKCDSHTTHREPGPRKYSEGSLFRGYYPLTLTLNLTVGIGAEHSRNNGKSDWLECDDV